MIREIAATDVRKNFGEILNEVKYRHDLVLIKKAGKPIAALIDVELFEKIKILKDQFDRLTMRLKNVYQEVHLDIAEKEIQEVQTSIKR